ncbi:MAG: tripartite tricarboxylate transporter substrate binding protein [Rhodospirillales bacterium]|nr:tripartite tricarboxylate transporter substrate binding protein [Rhodospirillales bacterium]
MSLVISRTARTAGRVASAACVAAALTIGSAAHAVDNLKILVPANPGGGWDQTGRAMQQVLQGAGLVKSIQVDNKGGAGGTIGLAQFVNSAKGDGNAIIVSGLVMVGAIITNKSPVNLTQVTPIARLTGEFEVIAVPANSPLKSMDDLVTAWKKDPGKMAWAGGSAGGTDHITVGLLAKAVGIDATKINYVAHSGGGEAVAQLLGGHLPVGVNGYAEFQAQIEAGKLRALGISSPKRLPGVNVPTFIEQNIKVEIANWRGVFGAPGITAAQKKDLSDTIDKMVKTPAWKEILKKNSWADFYLTSDEYAKYVTEENTRVTAILKDIGLVK